MTLGEIKNGIKGQWASVATELRPSTQKNEDGSLKPFYLSRDFKYGDNDSFELSIFNSADPNGKIPLAKISIKGHITWEGGHPIAPGAQKVNFTADEAYEVTPLLPAFADVLNRLAVAGYETWVPGQAQSIFEKTFTPFGLTAGQHFMEFDLIYLFNDLLFWGARNIDGRGFDREENRPTNLQIPLIRK